MNATLEMIEPPVHVVELPPELDAADEREHRQHEEDERDEAEQQPEHCGHYRVGQ